MGRIGRSYPRIPPAPLPAGRAKRWPAHHSQLAGAAAGVLAALGLIGWLLTR